MERREIAPTSQALQVAFSRLFREPMLSESTSFGSRWGIYEMGSRYKRQEVAGGLIQEEPPIVSLYRADLTDANLSRMYLILANLNGAQLVGADLSDARLSTTTLGSASIFRAMREELPLEDVEQPVAPSKLAAANLRGADLRGAQLLGVDLTGANLSGADLTGARVTDEQLEMCHSLEGATMPNGQKYEDWLKSKGRAEDGENDGPS